MVFGGGVTFTADGVVLGTATRFEALSFTGGVRADTIRGGSGADSLTGATVNSAPTDNDLLFGGSGADTLTGRAAGDTLYGGLDDDLLFGGVGVDSLIGGAGADLFALEFAYLGAAAANLDRVRDFQQGLDRLDFSRVDADSLTVLVNDAFDFIGTAAGQVRAVSNANRTLVTGDVDGDGVADFMFLLNGSFILTDAGFVL